jgi:replicative DNA helicase
VIHLQNTSAEQGLLGCILIQGDLIKEVSLTANQFSDEQHQKIFEAMRELEKRNEPIDLISVVTEIGEQKVSEVGGVSYLSDLANSIPSTEAYSHYERYITNAWKVRLARRYVNEFQNNVLHNEANVIPALIYKLTQLEEIGQAQEFSLKEILMQVFEDIETRHVEGPKGIKSGYKYLDNMTAGWQKQDLIIVAARPSLGKTAFALNTGLAAAFNNAVLVIFSLEMPTKLLIYRMVSFVGSINADKLRDPKSNPFDPEDWERMTNTMSRLNALDMFIYDEPNITVQDIRSKVRKLKRQFPDKDFLVIIDYLQLMKGNGDNRVQEIGEITRSLKITAREFDLPIILLSQLSRAVEQRQDKRPMMSDLRDSGNIEQDADIVAFLYRDDYYNAETDKKNIVEVIISKHRNGPTGKVELVFLKHFNKFINLDYAHKTPPKQRGDRYEKRD